MRATRLLAGVAVLAVIAGCADQVKQLEPKLALRDAAQHLAEQQRGGFTIKLTGNPDDLVAALKSDGKDVRTLFNSSLAIAYDHGDAATPDDDRMMLAATVDGITGAEVRVLGQTIYAKAPVTDLTTKFGGSASDLAGARDEMAGSSSALGSFFDGKWVSLDLKDAGSLAGQATGLPAQDVQNAKTIAELRTSARNLVDGAQITRDPADAKHLIVTSSTTKAYSEMKRLVTAVGGDQADAIAGEMSEAPKDRPIVLDLWVDHEKLTAAEVNILQFVDGATGRVAVRLDVTDGAPIEAPAGAEKIDPKALQSLTADATGDDAVSIAQALGYQTLAIADYRGGKPASHLKEAIAEFGSSSAKATVVRSGVAEVTTGGRKACLTLPATANGKPKVTAGAC